MFISYPEKYKHQGGKHGYFSDPVGYPCREKNYQRRGVEAEEGRHIGAIEAKEFPHEGGIRRSESMLRYYRIPTPFGLGPCPTHTCDERR